MRFSLLKFLVGKDIYGHGMGVNLGGDGTFKTRVGALLTIVSYLLISINFFTLLQDFISRSTQVETS